MHSVLGANPNTWTVLTFHHPIFSSAKDRDNPRLRELWQPIFDKYHVDLVLQGHDHTYGRTDLRVAETAPAVATTNGAGSAEGESARVPASERTGGTENVAVGESVRDPQSGTVYVVSVSGPKMYNLNRDQGFKRAAEDTQLYQIISVNRSSLRYEARTAKGDLYDAFTLNKRPGQANELVEQIPNKPERLRPAMPVEEPAKAASKEEPKSPAGETPAKR
jgi:hypothetical protein